MGGAPSNFAYILRLLVHETTVASRVGDDTFGREAADGLDGMGVVADHLQVDTSHHTGTVDVKIGEGGETRQAGPLHPSQDVSIGCGS